MTDQFIKKIENSNFNSKIRIKILNFKTNTLNANTNRLVILLISKLQQEQEQLFDEKVAQEGLKNWLEIFSNVHNWKIKNENEIFETFLKPQAEHFSFSISKIILNFKKEKNKFNFDHLNIINSSSSKESFYKLLTKDSNFRKHFSLNNQTIMDVIALSTGGVSMNSKDLHATIDFFLKFNFYRQLVCLITYQKNPPILLDDLFILFSSNDNIEKISKVFEYLIMMNPDKLNNFFIQAINKTINSSSSSNLPLMLSSLVASNRRLSTQFYKILIMVLDSKVITTYDLIKSVSLGFIASNWDIHDDPDHLFHCNEQLIDFLKTLPCEKKEIENVCIALKACRVINLIKMDPYDFDSILYAIRFHDENDDEIVESEGFRLCLLFKFLRITCSKVDDGNFYVNFIKRFEVKLDNEVF